MLSLLSQSNIPGMQSLVSQQADVVHDTLSRRLSNHKLACRRPGPMDARIYSLELAAIQLVELSYGVDVEVEADVSPDHFLVHIGLEGETQMWAGGKSHPLGTDALMVSNPGAPLRVQMTGECRHFAVRMPVSLCTDYLTRHLNVPLNRPLEFYAGREGSRELPVVWRGMMAHLCEQLRLAPTMMGHRRIQRHYGTLLAEILLGNYCNSYSEQIAIHGNDISPRHVRRARDIIHASKDDTISIADLAQRVGVSVRSLQNGFRQFLGVTPLEYVRRHRLEQLHRALMDEQSRSSVTELMLECGIVNFGRYAQYYRQQYGCLPSETLRRHHPSH
ncbi:AraC family transcriptional regulator [Novosphingobium rosa]|uniref:AraC family transcriptional regulator n=1 Tax=Novosphingobium rosa TaxID=76978 RepID=UPI0008339AC4|nr:AraC family transcriptional regulator [Novosphingobium rosa]